ncbi:adenine phosphoribosyltransferase [Pseudothermotoga thermarum]|uniref:Adenine phosphoribosyltransferase n=1 Tax=Pseudothermotoga thermarum DSM 5069 TaxID=688269 RepID=F7YVC8_9THEM|nr:adenine phosphoribosyltransferase [Pseudothermotoga thermarum]AEH50431.1 adenine phosphoribosyltransferase [Pseudothermotoga thermarum DSM 5069]
MDLKKFVRDIPDFPVKGIIFRDVTPLLKSPQAFKFAVDEMARILSDVSFDCIVSPEARGFIFGAALAYKLGKGFVPVRKPGKLPYETVSLEYQLEYGTAQLQIHADAIEPGQKVLIVDDVLATGGTAEAIGKLVQKLGGQVAAMCFLIELTYLNPRERLKGYDVRTVLKY